jgi:hypothetical protein
LLLVSDGFIINVAQANTVVFTSTIWGVSRSCANANRLEIHLVLSFSPSGFAVMLSDIVRLSLSPSSPLAENGSALCDSDSSISLNNRRSVICEVLSFRAQIEHSLKQIAKA